MKRALIPAAASCAVAALCASAALLLASCAQSVEITVPRYAFIYGVSVYFSTAGEGKTVNGYSNLSYSDDDAKSMADLMNGYGWNVQSRIKGSAGIVSAAPITDGPSKANMILDLQAEAPKIAQDSTVLFYFSGHGTTGSEGTPYIVPYQGVTDSTSPEVKLSDCVSPSDLSSMLTILPTKNVIVIFDTCFSGGFVSTGSAIDSSPQDYSTMQSFSAFSTAFANFGDLLSANASASGGKTPIVLSAAGSQEECYDGSSSQGHGVFTYYLLQAAAQGDANGDGIVTTTEAYSYTSAKLEDWGATETAEDYPDGSPFLPHLSGGVRDLVLFGPR